MAFDFLELWAWQHVIYAFMIKENVKEFDI